MYYHCMCMPISVWGSIRPDQFSQLLLFIAYGEAALCFVFLGVLDSLLLLLCLVIDPGPQITTLSRLISQLLTTEGMLLSAL